MVDIVASILADPRFAAAVREVAHQPATGAFTQRECDDQTVSEFLSRLLDDGHVDGAIEAAVLGLNIGPFDDSSIDAAQMPAAPRASAAVTAPQCGVVLFDDPKAPRAGWAAFDGREARRIGGVNELHGGARFLWWSNIGYDAFFRTTELWRINSLRHDTWLVGMTPTDVLSEWGYGGAGGTDPKFAATFLSEAMARVVRLATAVLARHDPALAAEQMFTAPTLSGDLRRLLPPPVYPGGEAAEAMSNGAFWCPIVQTNLPVPDKARIVTLRRPRLDHAMEMLATLAPEGPFKYMGRAELRDASPDASAWVRDVGAPVLAYVDIALDHAPRCASSVPSRTPSPLGPIGQRESKPQGKLLEFMGLRTAPGYGRGTRCVMAHPEFRTKVPVLRQSHKIGISGAWVGERTVRMSQPPAVSGLLGNPVSVQSWSTGVVADALWQATLLPERRGKDPTSLSWQGAWVKSADKARMFQCADALRFEGYTPISYGLGQVRVAAPEDKVPELFALSCEMGLLPRMLDVAGPLGFPAYDIGANWGGADRSRSLARMTFSGHRDLLSEMDDKALQSSWVAFC